jgi:uncharacterized protein (TIGR02271 family)
VKQPPIHHFLWRENKVYEKQKSEELTTDDVTLQLHKEELEIKKNWEKKADVKVYKRTFTADKQIIIPVTYEELIIEKLPLNSEGTLDGEKEIIRIPLKEDRIEVVLHPTILEDVEIYKRQYEEIIEVNEMVQKEVFQIETTGDVTLVKGKETKLF